MRKPRTIVMTPLFSAMQPTHSIGSAAHPRRRACSPSGVMAERSQKVVFQTSKPN